MTAKELIEHLSHAPPDESVLVFLRDTEDEDGGDCVYEVAAVRSTVEMDHEGTRHTTYLVAGDEMED